jgi:hypothetical protein
MDATTILYALSTLSQTCAALAALVGALGLFRLQSIRVRQADVERGMRHLLVNVSGSAEWANTLPTNLLVDRDAPAFVRDVNNDESRNRMQRFLDEWAAFDPDYRRTSRLLGLFIAWNIGAIGLSLVGFLFVYRLAGTLLSVYVLWILAAGTVLATGVMLTEMRGSFVTRFGHVGWLERRMIELDPWWDDPFYKRPKEASSTRGPASSTGFGLWTRRS